MTEVLKIASALGLSLALVMAYPAQAATDLVDLNMEALIDTTLISDSKYDRTQRSQV